MAPFAVKVNVSLSAAVFALVMLSLSIMQAEAGNNMPDRDILKAIVKWTADVKLLDAQNDLITGTLKNPAFIGNGQVMLDVTVSGVNMGSVPIGELPYKQFYPAPVAATVVFSVDKTGKTKDPVCTFVNTESRKLTTAGVSDAEKFKTRVASLILPHASKQLGWTVKQ